MKTAPTPAEIRELLLTKDSVVERAMVVLYARQTRQEQAQSTTRDQNGRGFSSSDASKGSYYARWVLSGRRLDGHHLERARSISLKYIRQLHEEAVIKAEKQNQAIINAQEDAREAHKEAMMASEAA